MAKVQKQKASSKKSKSLKPSFSRKTGGTKKDYRKLSFKERVRPVSQVDNGLAITIYGRQGSGKTRYACTFPKPILIIGAENGTGSVKNDEGVEFGELVTGYDIVEACEYAKEEGFKTVVLDTATAFQMKVLTEVLDLDEIPEQLSWGIATQQDWGQIANQMKEYLRTLLDLRHDNINVVVIAQEKEFDVGETDSELIAPNVGPALTKSTAGWLNEASDYLVHTFIRQRMKTVTTSLGKGAKKKTIKKSVPDKGVDFCLRTGPDETFMTKIRVPRGTELPDIVVGPTFENTKHLFGL